VVRLGRPAAALLAVLFLAACSSGGDGSVAFPKATGEPAGESNADLLDFEAPRLGGGSQVTGAELQGKDVALWFWAPW
jgi:hypothetical protein